jgi:hypothetical protein
VGAATGAVAVTVNTAVTFSVAVTAIAAVVATVAVAVAATAAVAVAATAAVAVAATAAVAAVVGSTNTCETLAGDSGPGGIASAADWAVLRLKLMMVNVLRPSLSIGELSSAGSKSWPYKIVQQSPSMSW